jgi:O-antigen/teichoic acid export membrane protein
VHQASSVPGRSADHGSKTGLPRILRELEHGDLRTQVRRGVVSTAGSRFVVQAMQLGATAVLARILTPADYGLSALVAVVALASGILVDMGIASAVIQQRHISGQFLATAFWMNTALAVAVAIAVAGSATSLSRFFGTPALAPLLVLASVTFLLTLNGVHLAILERALAFSTVGRIRIVSMLVGLAISVGAATAGLGAASLVLGPLADRLASVIQTFIVVRWLPRSGPSLETARRIWVFGRGLAGFSLLRYVVGSLDRVLIGHMLPVADLGHYNRAWNLMALPMQENTRVLSTVFYPAMAGMGSDAVRLRLAWLRLVRASWMIGVPAGAGLVLTAPSLVQTLYGSGWGAVVPLLAVMSGAVPFLLLEATAPPVFQALGRTGLQFRLEVVNAVLAVGIIVLGIQWGVLGVCAAVAIRAALSAAVSVTVLLNILGLRLRTLVAALWKTVVAGGAMGMTVYGIGLVSEGWTAVLVLVLQCVTGIVTYAILIWLLENTVIRSFMGRERSSGGR